MSGRHEEKYLLDYESYLLFRARARAALHPDPHGEDGSYTVSSLYFDDPRMTAFADKEDGQAEHIKYRIRAYDGDTSFLRLERKLKRGTITEKDTASLDEAAAREIALSPISFSGGGESGGNLFRLCAGMRADGVMPVVTVRYRREAFLLPGSDLRVTFDSRLAALPGGIGALSDTTSLGIPILHPNNVILEIKYNDYLPLLVRTLFGGLHVQVSVSKYAMCIGSVRNGTVRRNEK